MGIEDREIRRPRHPSQVGEDGGGGVGDPLPKRQVPSRREAPRPALGLDRDDGDHERESRERGEPDRSPPSRTPVPQGSAPFASVRVARGRAAGGPRGASPAWASPAARGRTRGPMRRRPLDSRCAHGAPRQGSRRRTGARRARPSARPPRPRTRAGGGGDRRTLPRRRRPLPARRARGRRAPRVLHSTPCRRTLVRWCPHGSSPKNWTSAMCEIHVSGCQLWTCTAVNAQATLSEVSPARTRAFCKT